MIIIITGIAMFIFAVFFGGPVDIFRNAHTPAWKIAISGVIGGVGLSIAIITAAKLSILQP